MNNVLIAEEDAAMHQFVRYNGLKRSYRKHIR
jgi:hypothetical protein